jgi:hypothetical protein
MLKNWWIRNWDLKIAFGKRCKPTMLGVGALGILGNETWALDGPYNICNALWDSHLFLFIMIA